MNQSQNLKAGTLIQQWQKSYVQSDKLAPHRVVDEGGHGVDVRAECVLLVNRNVVDVARHGSYIVYYR